LRQIPADLRERRVAIEHQLDLLASRLSRASTDRAPELRQAVELLVAQDAEIEARIGQAVRDRNLGFELRSLGELQRNLPPASVLLEYHLGEQRSYLWIVEPGKIRMFRLPKRAEIKAECAPVLALFPDILARKRSPQKQREFDRALAQISATLLGPLRDTFLAPLVMIVPDGILTQIPFASLRISSGERLGLARDLVQLPSAAYLAAGRTPGELADFPGAIFAVADPVYSQQDPRIVARPVSGGSAVQPELARLPFAKEIETITALIAPSRRRLLRAFDANVGAIEKSRLGDFAVLHFSTHALIDDRIPEISRIALSMFDASGRPIDGFLRPHQLSRFELRGSTVVLSACKTALGKEVLGEGLAGFAASLFAAGAGRLVLTVSEVDAESSSEFWSETYKRVFGSPHTSTSFERATRLARRSLAQSAEWSDPYYWAPYAIYGCPSRTSKPTSKPGHI